MSGIAALLVRFVRSFSNGCPPPLWRTSRPDARPVTATSTSRSAEPADLDSRHGQRRRAGRVRRAPGGAHAGPPRPVERHERPHGSAALGGVRGARGARRHLLRALARRGSRVLGRARRERARQPGRGRERLPVHRLRSRQDAALPRAAPGADRLCDPGLVHRRDVGTVVAVRCPDRGRRRQVPPPRAGPRVDPRLRRHRPAVPDLRAVARERPRARRPASSTPTRRCDTGSCRAWCRAPTSTTRRTASPPPSRRCHPSRCGRGARSSSTSRHRPCRRRSTTSCSAQMLVYTSEDFAEFRAARAEDRPPNYRIT